VKPKDFSHVEPKPAATVLLARDGADGLEVFMVKRHGEIEFASGAMVFPGGKVDEGDRDKALRNACKGAEGLDEGELALRLAALRETFEECGVLLARRRGKDPLVDFEDLARLAPWAGRMHRGEATLGEFVAAENLELALDELAYFAHWITPPLAPKRFDTHFFLVAAPPGQVAVHDGSESVDSVWARPAETTAEADAGRCRLVFATRLNLEKLDRSSNVAEAMAAARQASVVTVRPQLEKFEDGIRTIRIPEEAGYGGAIFEVTDKPAMEVKAS
jgi:8-oxo-dGTP pyrophosphatase MutT (NUDIX family)|tara:strand:+ start:524 stop:1348 length:825 start_codon:yes stop_codon:yes gene_type:complete